MYFCPLGKDDYLKLNNEYLGLWHFLEEQPDGWLMSLAFKHKCPPPETAKRFHDCGAFTYRQQSTPKIRGCFVSAAWAIAEYKLISHEGDIVLAPDHIPFQDIEQRQGWNRDRQCEFIKAAPAQLPGRRYAAAVHGCDIKERVENALYLYELGYRTLAIGGLVPLASDKQRCLEIVQSIKEALPNDVWLHVFGLCAPDYAKAFHDLGINSFDGASHLKEAFNAGTFFITEGNSMVKYKAVCPGSEITAPLCYCKACSTLRERGIDTRTYGSNQHNMGRAVHNLNQLLIAHKNVMASRTIALVSCVGQKLNVPAPASSLYTSQWFNLAHKYVEYKECEWYILSAKHGVVAPTQVLEPYEITLNEMSKPERQQWAKLVANQLRSLAPGGGEFIFLAGEKYREFVIPQLKQWGYTIRVPMQGLEIGQQLQWLAKQVQKSEYIQLSLF